MKNKLKNIQAYPFKEGMWMITFTIIHGGKNMNFQMFVDKNEETTLKWLDNFEGNYKDFEQYVSDYRIIKKIYKGEFYYQLNKKLKVGD